MLVVVVVVVLVRVVDALIVVDVLIPANDCCEFNIDSIQHNAIHQLRYRYACFAHIHALYMHALHASLDAWYTHIMPLQLE